MGDGPSTADGSWEVGIQNPDLERGLPIMVCSPYIRLEIIHCPI